MDYNNKLARHFEMVARGEIAICAACVNFGKADFKHCQMEASNPKFSFNENVNIAPRDYVTYLTKFENPDVSQ